MPAPLLEGLGYGTNGTALYYSRFCRGCQEEKRKKNGRAVHAEGLLCMILRLAQENREKFEAVEDEEEGSGGVGDTAEWRRCMLSVMLEGEGGSKENWHSILRSLENRFAV
jgi:hypothetical protein